MGYRMLLIAIFPTDSRCHGNEIWDKIGYDSACVTDICKIFCICEGIFGNGPSIADNWILPDRPLLPWQQNLKQQGLYLSLYKKNINKVLASDGGAGWGFGN